MLATATSATGYYLHLERDTVLKDNAPQRVGLERNHWTKLDLT